MQSVMASDIREDPAFLGALKRREAVISGLHLSHWRSDAQVVSVYEPVYDRKEKYRLMVMADMDVRTIAINLQGLQVPTGTSLFLFDGGGRLLASSLRQTDEETGVSDPAVFPVLSKNQAPSIQAANLALAGQKGGYVVNEEKTLRIKQGDELYYVYVSPVVRGSGQDWSFAIVITFFMGFGSRLGLPGGLSFSRSSWEFILQAGLHGRSRPWERLPRLLS
jgi:hypothetical protein